MITTVLVSVFALAGFSFIFGLVLHMEMRDSRDRRREAGAPKDDFEKEDDVR